MELIAREIYRSTVFTLQVGDSTADLAVKLSDTEKRQLLSDFPESFEVIQEAGKLETPEDRLDIETAGRATRKK